MVGRGELAEDAWSAIASLLPASGGRRGRQWRDPCALINGILWKLPTGSPPSRATGIRAVAGGEDR